LPQPKPERRLPSVLPVVLEEKSSTQETDACCSAGLEARPYPAPASGLRQDPTPFSLLIIIILLFSIALINGNRKPI
jgi:hypothetical protein